MPPKEERAYFTCPHCERTFSVMEVMEYTTTPDGAIFHCCPYCYKEIYLRSPECL